MYKSRLQKYRRGVKALAKDVKDITTVAMAAKKIANYAKPKYIPKISVNSNKKLTLQQKSLNKQIKEVKRQLEGTTATFVFKQRNSAQFQTSVNQADYLVYGGLYPSVYESILANLKYYNPSNPSSLLTVSGATGAYQREYTVSKASNSITAINNYQVPAKVRIYCCEPKVDTSIAPDVSIDYSLADESNVDATDIMIYPTDCTQFNDLWKITSSKIQTLYPGEALTVSHSIPKSFQYDPAFADTHSLTYLKQFKSFVFLIRLEGVLGHDTSTGETGQLQAGVDVQSDRRVEIKYDGGADINYVYSTNTNDSFTNGGVVSSKPVCDNIGFSQA